MSTVPEYETDYISWFKYSQSIQNLKKASSLKHLLECKNQINGFNLLMEANEQGTYYILSEDYNPNQLKISPEDLEYFIRYIEHFYGDQLEFYEIEKEHPSDSINDSTTEPETDNNEITGKRKIYFQPQRLIRWLPSKNKIIHALRFSFINFLLAQYIILKGNLGEGILSDNASYYFFSTVFLLSVAVVFSYPKQRSAIKQYRDIFKLLYAFNGFLFLLIFLEVNIIDTASGDFNILAQVFLIVLGQIAALIISSFLSMFFYFIKGGKLMYMKK